MTLPRNEPRFEFKVALTQSERDGHFLVRHEVFVTEQGVFAASDRDVHDEGAATEHLVALADEQVVGAVRIYPLDSPDVWLGDRLSVAVGYRTFAVGAELVRLAVATAAARGGLVMHAHIQMPNVRFFTRLGWEAVGPSEIYVGIPHQPMSIGLSGPPLRE